MLNRLRQRAGDEGGFTLIELLVVILIIGILAGIAIPAFLAQKNKAVSASAKSMVASAETAAETYGTDNNGSFENLSPGVINEYEHTIPTAEQSGEGKPWVSAATGNGSGYTVTISVKVAGTIVKFSAERNSEGIIKKTCEPQNPTLGCPKSGEW